MDNEVHSSSKKAAATIADDDSMLYSQDTGRSLETVKIILDDPKSAKKWTQKLPQFHW